jgi:mono/diheme cytochrome c family protein
MKGFSTIRRIERLSILIPLLAVLMCVQAVLAAPPDQAATNTFGTTCASCHGQKADGNTAIAKALHVPDLRSSPVQSQSDAQLQQIISDGKGNMPSFKNSLTADQITSLVQYIRSLKQQK